MYVYMRKPVFLAVAIFLPSDDEKFRYKPLVDVQVIH